MKKAASPFDSATAAASRREANRYLTPKGKERHAPEDLRNTFDYLITMLNGTKSGKVADREADLRYLSGRLFYCTDHMTPNVVDLLGRLDINIEEEYAIHGFTYAAAAHDAQPKLWLSFERWR